MAVSTIQNPGDIFFLQDGQLQQITHHYDYLENEFYLPEQEVISWQGEDGVTIEGIIYYPHNYESGKRTLHWLSILQQYTSKGLSHMKIQVKGMQ